MTTATTLAQNLMEISHQYRLTLGQDHPRTIAAAWMSDAIAFDQLSVSDMQQLHHLNLRPFVDALASRCPEQLSDNNAYINQQIIRTIIAMIHQGTV